MSVELILNRVSMIALVVAGIFFLYEGGVLIDSHRQNPQRIPAKVAVAGTLTIILGIISIGFAILHFFFDSGDTNLFKSNSNTNSNSKINAKVNANNSSRR